MAAPVVHFEVIGRDLDTLLRFYGELFDWELSPVENAAFAFVAAPEGGAGIGGSIGAAPNDPYGATFYVQVPDLDAALAEAERLGGRTAMPPTEVGPGIWVAQLDDPEGHRIGLLRR
jgi:uncharacterized protein